MPYRFHIRSIFFLNCTRLFCLQINLNMFDSQNMAFYSRLHVVGNILCSDSQNGHNCVVRCRVRLHRGTVPDRRAEYGLGSRIVFRQNRRDRSSVHQQHGMYSEVYAPILYATFTHCSTSLVRYKKTFVIIVFRVKFGLACRWLCTAVWR